MSTQPLQTGPRQEVVTAPAKLTLSLRITGIRSDGYHLLEAEMATLDLADELIIESRPIEEGNDLTVSTDSAGSRTGWASGSLSVGADNLVVRALVVVGRAARVHLVKRVPPGAGLGGGSADAAAVLRWAGCTDLALAASLGADVPFCVHGGRAMVRGVGEAVAPLPYEDRRFVLLLLPFGVDTGTAYRAWDGLARQGGRATGDVLANDLEEAALMVEPRLGPWRARFEELTGCRPHLAGSGSTWFVEGSPEQLGIRSGQALEVGDETGVVVAARTTPPLL